MRRVGRLFEQVASFENLNRAFLDAARGHRTRPAVQGFRVELERRLFEIRAELLDGDYRWGEYRSFYVADTKRRLILAAPFRDRVVHHALVQVLEPVLDPTFIDGCFACRKGKGNHAAVERLRAWVERSPRAART